MSVLHDNDVNVVANGNWSCLLTSAVKDMKSAIDCYQMERQIQQDQKHGALHALHVSLNNASRPR